MQLYASRSRTAAVSCAPHKPRRPRGGALGGGRIGARAAAAAAAAVMSPGYQAWLTRPRLAGGRVGGRPGISGRFRYSDDSSSGNPAQQLGRNRWHTAAAAAAAAEPPPIGQQPPLRPHPHQLHPQPTTRACAADGYRRQELSSPNNAGLSAEADALRPPRHRPPTTGSWTRAARRRELTTPHGRPTVLAALTESWRTRSGSRSWWGGVRDEQPTAAAREREVERVR
jgi:hypothetical protein